MKCLLTAVAASALLNSQAFADDRWSGWYVGANAGAAWGNSELVSNAYCTGPTNTCPWNLGVLSAFGAGATGSGSDTGFTGGMQTGYSWQDGPALFGIEADLNAFDFNSSAATTALFPGSTVLIFTSSTTASTDWLVTLRGRLGWTVTPGWLLYATGGLALTELKIANSYQDNASLLGPAAANIVGSSRSSSTKIGFAVGGGAEAALDKNWSVRAEYLYVDFGSADTTLTTNGLPGLGLPNPNAMTSSADLDASIARVGVSYRWR